MADFGDDTLHSQYPDWCEAPPKQAFGSIFAQVRDFDRTVMSSVSSNAFLGLRQYTGRDISSLTSSTHFGSLDINNQLNMTSAVLKASFNLTASVIDTLTAKLASIESVPQAVTNKGNAKGRKLAEDLNHLVKGIFHKHQISHTIQLAFRDAMIKRLGYIKVLRDEDSGIKVERLYFDEVIIDPADGYYNNPYKTIQRKSVPIHVVKQMYPQFLKAIEDCEVKEIRLYNTRNYTPCITVAEAWCKNTYMPGGRRVVCIETADLIDESWDKDYLPIIKVDYNEPVVGFMGNSVVDDLLPIQMEIDRIIASVQAILKTMSVPSWLVDTNAQMNKNHRTNKIGLIWEGDFKNGIAPILHNGAAMPPEIMQALEFFIQQGYARAGLTPMDTQGQQKTGAGNQSGEALKTMTEIKSERWQLLQHNFEQKHVQVAEIILKELQGTKVKVSALDRSIGLREVTAKVIPKTSDSYVLRMFPVSSLPDSIPDLIDSVTQMLQLGVIQPSQVPDLFNMPDLDAHIALQTAPRKLIDMRLEKMIDTKVYTHPEPYHDLDYAAIAAMQQYNWAQLNDESDDILSLLRRYINDVKTLISQRPPPPPQPEQTSKPKPQGVPQ